MRYSSPKPVHESPKLQAGSGLDPMHWTKDGKGILYTTSERANIWLERLDGGAPQKVTDYSDQMIFRFAPSPDHRAMLIVRGTQTRDV